MQSLFFEFMSVGGPVMWVILGLSVLGGAVVIEKIFFFAFSSVSADKLRQRVGEACSLDALREILAQETRREVFRASRHIGVLSTVARVAPLLGLLGTVLGMVEMFKTLPDGGSMVAVAGGIWKALFTTVAGLAVAIPALILHAWLCSLVDAREEKLQRAGERLIREKLKA